MPHPKKTKTGQFWLFSLALHGIVLGVILWVAPVREVIFSRTTVPKEPEVMTRGEELAEIIDELRDRTAEELAARVELLADGQRRMADNFETLNTHYQPFAEQQRSTARVRLEYYAAAAMKRLGVMHENGQAAVNQEDPEVLLAVADEHMSRILTAMEEVKRGLYLVEAEDLLKQQEEALDQQFTANQHIGWLRGVHERIPQLSEKLKEIDGHIQAREEQIASLEKQANGETKLDRDQRHELSRAKRSLEDWRRQRKPVADRLEKARKDLPGRLRTTVNIQSGAYWKQKELTEALEAHLGEPAAADTLPAEPSS